MINKDLGEIAYVYSARAMGIGWADECREEAYYRWKITGEGIKQEKGTECLSEGKL